MHDIPKIIWFQKIFLGQNCVIQIAAKGLKYMPERVLTKFQKKKKKKKKKNLLNGVPVTSFLFLDPRGLADNLGILTFFVS